MNSEIKFRAWDSYHKEMITPWCELKENGHFWGEDTTNKPIYVSSSEHVMQYTGLKDKNGKEIYEGDIIRMAGKFWYVVRFEDAKFVCYHTKEDYGKWGDLHRLFDHDFSNYGWSVVGNIYENPELLATSNHHQP